LLGNDDGHWRSLGGDEGRLSPDKTSTNAFDCRIHC
jgi:hypothetical protein